MIQRLFVYGTLKPGHANAHLLETIGGTWQPASVIGTLLPVGWGADQGYPALMPDENGAEVHGLVFTPERLAQHWRALDQFEGDYERVLTPGIEGGGRLGTFTSPESKAEGNMRPCSPDQLRASGL
jgi:gamma-glutamylcyclotransferase (GGCT)/AIG2-like uncharacterized protein YtfP